MHKQLTNPEVAIKIELIPSIEQDKRTGLFVARFEQFPRASAAGKTPQEATDELLIIFGVMLKEKEEDITKQIVTEYFQKITKSEAGHQRLKEAKVYA